MREILVVDAFKLGALIASYDGKRNAFVHNQELLTLFVDCVVADIQVKIILPRKVEKIPQVAVQYFNDLLGNVKDQLGDKTKAALMTQELTDDLESRITELAQDHKQILLITANDKLRLRGVNIFTVEPADKETGSIAIELIRQELFGAQDSDNDADDEASDAEQQSGRRSPPGWRLFQDLDPAPGQPGPSGATDSPHR